MGLNISAFPRYVYQQDAQPTGVANGSLWIDTNSSPRLVYVYDGSTWSSLTTDIDFVANAVLQLGINVLINSTAASSTLNDYNKIFVDVFTDADGTSNTIDTGATTAYHTSEKYQNLGAGTPATENSVSPGTTQTLSDVLGMRVTPDVDVFLNSITKEATCNATSAYLYSGASTDTLLNTASFVGNVATFASPSLLASGTAYGLLCGINDGDSCNHRYTDGQGFPTDTGNLVWNGSVTKNSSSVSATQTRNLVSANISPMADPTNKIVQTNSITIPSGIAYHQIYSKKATAGSGAITYDISADGGSTWDTAQSLDNKNPFGATTGTSCIIKLNLNGVGAGNTAEAENYGLLVYI